MSTANYPYNDQFSVLTLIIQGLIAKGFQKLVVKIDDSCVVSRAKMLYVTARQTDMVYSWQTGTYHARHLSDRQECKAGRQVLVRQTAD